MKLVEIKDIRFGQIRKNFNDTILIVEIKSDGFSYYKKYDEFGNLVNTDVKLNIKFLDMPIIGFFGITHEIKDNKLVEISREDLIINDVVEYLDFDGFKVTAVICAVITGYTSENTQYAFITEYGQSDDTTLFEREEVGEDRGVFTYTPKKIGILGVTHEFINERLAK